MYGLLDGFVFFFYRFCWLLALLFWILFLHSWSVVLHCLSFGVFFNVVWLSGFVRMLELLSGLVFYGRSY
jgi:hypothetical protein